MATHDDLDGWLAAATHEDTAGWLAARPHALRRRGRGADPARTLTARGDRRVAQRADAREPALPAGGRAGGMRALLQAAPAQGVCRVRDAARRERPGRAGALARRPA